MKTDEQQLSVTDNWHGWMTQELVLEAVQMLLLHLAKTDRMRPLYGSESLDLPRRMCSLDLQGANRKGQCWWRRRRGWEDRLRAAGVDSETRSLVDPVKFYAAVKRVIVEKAEKTRARKLSGFSNLSGAKPPAPATLPKQKFDPTARFRKKITEGELPRWENPSDPKYGT